jgi:hypothetical protein
LEIRLHLPRRVLWKGLWRPLLLNGALLLLAEGVSSWLWGDWGNGLLPGLVAGVSLYRLGSLAPQVLSRFAARAFGLEAGLRALIGRERLAMTDCTASLPSSLA